MMAALSCLELNISKLHLKSHLRANAPRIRILFHLKPSFRLTHFRNCSLLRTRNFAWDATLPYASGEDFNGIIKGSNIVEAIDAEIPPDFAFRAGNQDDVVEVKDEPFVLQKPLKWPMWLIGPLILLATGVVPTLWLPLSSAFLGPNVAGFLALVGLDCIFNMGAMLFLLMADACAKSSSLDLVKQIPPSYKLWNIAATLVGFVAPLALLFASHRGVFQPRVEPISFAVLLGPYLLLLSIQMLTEMLTWHWKSPVWLVTPVVYEAYRVLQLMRGLTLAGEVGAPAWMVESLRGLVSWWVLVLGIQLMRVASLAGISPAAQSKYRANDGDAGSEQ